MKEYSYTTRNALWDNYKKEFGDKQKKGLDETTLKINSEITNSYYDYADVPNIEAEIEKMLQIEGFLPSQYTKSNLDELVNCYVPKTDQVNYYQAIDKLNQFQYSRGYDRRTVRTKSYVNNLKVIFSLLNDYLVLGFFKCTLSQYLTNELSEELLDFKENGYSRFGTLDHMIAQAIDSGDIKFITCIQDMILSDNNTIVVTRDVIRGIIKSSNGELHELLGKFLLAAKLQEGVRQVICENMDCGTVEGFLTLFKVVYDNNLIRFASVKRAIATWTGICDEENMDRITQKILELMNQCLYNKDVAYEYANSNDSIQIMIALWSLGFYEINDSIEVMNNYVDNGTKNQLLTMSYYNKGLSYAHFTKIISKKIIEKYPQELDIIGGFMPTYLNQVDSNVYDICENIKKPSSKKSKTITYYFQDTTEARAHLAILKELFGNMPKKNIIFSPCIFPWYGVNLSKTQLIKRISLIAYLLEDNSEIEFAAEHLVDIDISENYSSRERYMTMLLHQPKTERQKDCLIAMVADKESYTRQEAYRLVNELELESSHYLRLEEMLRFKTADLRQNVIALLGKQQGTAMVESVGRILANKKEEVRSAGLDIVLQLKKQGNASQFSECVKLVQLIKEPTDKEQLLITEISGGNESSSAQDQQGYGLYDLTKMRQFSFEIPKRDKKFFKKIFSMSKKELDKKFQKLDDFIDAHKTLTYTTCYGAECVLGNSTNGLSVISYGQELPIGERYPFTSLWEEFYHQEIKEPVVLLNMLLAITNGLDDIVEKTVYEKYEAEITGIDNYLYDISKFTYGGVQSKNYRGLFHDILNILTDIYVSRQLEHQLAVETTLFVLENIKDNELWYNNKETTYRYYSPGVQSFLQSPRVNRLMRGWNEHIKSKPSISYKEGSADKQSADFVISKEEKFKLLYEIDKKEVRTEIVKENPNGYVRTRKSRFLNIFDYIYACKDGIIEEEAIYYGAFEYIGLKNSLNDLALIMKETLRPGEDARLLMLGFIKEREEDGSLELTKKIYWNIVNTVADIECRRGDTPTIFSADIFNITKLQGLPRLITLLKAMGNNKFDRSTYYGWNNNQGKAGCLSHMIKVCFPTREDNAIVLGELLKGSSIKEQRLIEVAMYSPQWIDIIEEYLGYKGLKNGCFYFMAHMNESFDDKKQAMIAKYTPLSPDDLQNGGFDIQWFKEAYTMLGKDRFELLYDSAKYISDGNKHGRGRKYADAALGKVTVSAVMKEITSKRNKDLLMSLGIIPIKDNQDMINRYEFFNRFKKESTSYGAQRRASEGLAVNIAMKNLATNAGYADVTRLTLTMETELIKTWSKYFQWKKAKDAELMIEISDSGHATILCKKSDKILKNVPANLKKNEYYLEIKEVHQKLKEQYSRSVKLFEQAMEEREEYQLKELLMLMTNDVIRPILEGIVFVDSKGNTGFLVEQGLRNWENKIIQLDTAASVYVAHTYDIYTEGNWHKYQTYIFEQSMIQPFKQVFRELYLKTADELNLTHSLMFAGNQIQPQKTVGCLKGRRWIADYEEGLQKVFYKENIVACIYALADWFSPSDIEAPTLEWVEFSDRKTFKSLPIKDVPDILFSEVMRDVDLAVSVAHAGGVDPETSHSTIEMRRSIITFNLSLFGITNVTLEGNFAMIKGTHGEYTVHLGSGVVHQMAHGMLNILPVHSQSRGKLFLPFVDEDPKTAEIMSKILLLAQDDKIKDPSIMEQIKK